MSVQKYIRHCISLVYIFSQLLYELHAEVSRCSRALRHINQAEECTITGTHLPNNHMYNWSLLLLSEDVRCTRVYSLARQHVCYQLTYLSLPLMNTDKHRGVPNWDHVLRTDANAVLCFTCLSVSEKQTILNRLHIDADNSISLSSTGISRVSKYKSTPDVRNNIYIFYHVKIRTKKGSTQESGIYGWIQQYN